MTAWPPRPSLGTSFYKGHGLGNDYLVFEEGAGWTATEDAVERVCDPHRGVGGDGIVVLLRDRSDGVARLRMFNPDGGEFERSGNGLRVLGSYLARAGERGPWTVSVGGDRVRMALQSDGVGPAYDLEVEMGQARIGPEAVGLDTSALDAEGRIALGDGRSVVVVPVAVGNPHLVVPVDTLDGERLGSLGRALGTHPALSEGANVQLARATGPRACSALVWERGVGPTASSGTSACAVAAALVSLGRLDAGGIDVEMPGGTLRVGVDAEFALTLRGPVEAVCEGQLLL